MLTIEQSSVAPLRVEHVVTTDMADGQPLPPYGHLWRVVRRDRGRTLWRRLSLALIEVSSHE